MRFTEALKPYLGHARPSDILSLGREMQELEKDMDSSLKEELERQAELSPEDRDTVWQTFLDFRQTLLKGKEAGTAEGGSRRTPRSGTKRQLSQVRRCRSVIRDVSRSLTPRVVSW